MDGFDVAVIGLGAMGSATAFELARQGKKVVVFERFHLGHHHGSSHGESRAIRLTYFEGRTYVPLLQRAFAKWEELEKYANRTIMTKTGMFNAGCPGSTMVSGAIERAKAEGLQYRELSAADIRRNFPRFKIPPAWSAMLDPNGGFLRPELATRTFAEGALNEGAVIRYGSRVDAIDPNGSSVKIRLGLETVEAASVVVTTGPWIAELIPEVEKHLSGHSQQVTAWFRPARPELSVENRFPVFGLEINKDELLYGFPDFAGTGVKAAFHIHKTNLTGLADRTYEINPLDVASISNAVAEYIPEAVDGTRQPDAQTCLYTNTRDEKFVIDHMSGHPNVVFASACSGHGFKFASVLGEVLAAMATTDGTDPSVEQFRLPQTSNESPS